MTERCSGDDRFIIAEHPIRTTDNVQYLTDEEINKFLDELDHNGDGRIDYDEVEFNLDKAHRELDMKHGAHHVTNPDNEHHDEQAPGPSPCRYHGL